MSEEARKYITEIFKLVKTDSVLVVMFAGVVKRVYCPFIVICKVNIPPLKKGNEYFVEAVKMTLNLEDVFIIEGKAYFVWYFTIKL